MKINDVTFEKCQIGWICRIGFRFTSGRQFTDEYQQIEVGRRRWWAAYFAARWQVKFHIKVHGATKADRKAIGWAS